MIATKSSRNFNRDGIQLGPSMRMLLIFLPMSIVVSLLWTTLMVSAFSTSAPTVSRLGGSRWQHHPRHSSACIVPMSASSSDDAAASFSTSIQDGYAEVDVSANAFEQRFDKNGKGGFNADEFKDILHSLDMEATDEECRVMFTYLDSDGNGFIDYEEFATWYGSAVEDTVSSTTQFRDVLMSRRTVERFEATPVSVDVLRRAIECAIMAPNRSGSEPWRFVQLGPDTVQRIQQLNTDLQQPQPQSEQEEGDDSTTRGTSSSSFVTTVADHDWTNIPGWCVVTSKVSPDDPDTELQDFRSTSCAMQNFMLSMWSEGVGSKWTEGSTQKTTEFADLVGIDTDIEKVVGIIWYGFAKHTTTPGGGADDTTTARRKRQKSVKDVLSILP